MGRVMISYLVYSKNSKPSIFIADKFSYKAVIFSILWSLYNHMWYLSSLLCMLIIIINRCSAKNIISEQIALNFIAFICIVIGFFNVEIIRYSLKSRGYNFVDVVIASNKEEAMIKYYNNIL
jgi:hypothetical protein